MRALRGIRAKFAGGVIPGCVSCANRTGNQQGALMHHAATHWRQNTYKLIERLTVGSSWMKLGCQYCGWGAGNNSGQHVRQATLPLQQAQHGLGVVTAWSLQSILRGAQLRINCASWSLKTCL